MDRLILDSSVLVATERDPSLVLEAIPEDADVVMAAITAAELLTGVEMASSRHLAERRRWVERALAAIPIEPYDLDVARAHAMLLAWTHRSGQARGAHDLIVAASAAAHDRVVVTMDHRGFEGLPGVAVRPVR